MGAAPLSASATTRPPPLPHACSRRPAMAFLAKEMHHLKESAGSLLHAKHEEGSSGKHSAAGSGEGEPRAPAGAAAQPQVVHAHNTLHAETIPTYT